MTMWSNYSGMTTAQVTAMMNFVNSSELKQITKGPATPPRNAFYQQWQKPRLDLHFAQEIPIYKPAKVEVFFRFCEFWYVDRPSPIQLLRSVKHGKQRCLLSPTHGQCDLRSRRDGFKPDLLRRIPADSVIDNLQRPLARTTRCPDMRF